MSWYMLKYQPARPGQLPCRKHNNDYLGKAVLSKDFGQNYDNSSTTPINTLRRRRWSQIAWMILTNDLPSQYNSSTYSASSFLISRFKFDDHSINALCSQPRCFFMISTCVCHRKKEMIITWRKSRFRKHWLDVNIFIWSSRDMRDKT